MPPLLKPSILASTESWQPPVLQHFFETILLLVLFATVLRSILIARRKGRMANSGTGQNDSVADQEKKVAIHQRIDSYQEEELDLSREETDGVAATSEKKSNLEGRKDINVRQLSLDQKQNNYLQSLQQETLQPTLSPIYPWVSPPQILPGPYDAPYYPPPLPTIRAEEPLQIENQPSPTKTEAVSDNVPEELETISYTRRLSTNIIPAHDSLLKGTVTVSNKGWRRTQWTVTAG